MIFNVISEAIAGPWCINPSVIAQLRPLFSKVLAGASLGTGEEPLANLNYRLTFAAEHRDGEDEVQDVNSPEMSPVINVVPIRGMMFKNDQECGPRGTKTIGRRLSEADADPMVIGHIIVFETPGGTMGAINELEPVMQQLQKPVVGWIDGECCSAGLWIKSYCAESYASKDTDIIGSVGIYTELEARPAKSEANADGEVSVRVYADGSEDKNAQFETAINDFDFALIKTDLNKYYERFKGVVQSKHQNATDDQLHGKTFEAKELVGSLIDGIGPFQLAVDRVIALSDFTPKVQEQTTEGNSNSNLNNKVTMKQFAKVNGVLGVEELEATDEGVFLNEDQLGVLDSNLTNAGELATTQADLATAQEAQQAAVTAQETAEATVAATLAALDTIGPLVAAATDVTQKVAAVKTLLAAKIAVQPVGVLNKDVDLEASKEFDGFSAEEKEMIRNL